MIAANKSAPETRRKAGKKWNAGAAAAAAGLVAVAAGVAVWLARDTGGTEAETPEVRRPAPIAEVAPSAPGAADAAADAQAGGGAEAAKADEEAKEREQRRAAYKAMTPDERWEFVVERAKKASLREEPGKNRIFRTSTEQVMDWIFSCTVGDPPPLLPNLPLKEKMHLSDILASDNPVRADDSERAAQAKETVQLVKKEFQNYIREGGDPEEFLPYYHSQLVQAHNEWTAARKMAIDTVKQNPDIAADFLAEVNSRLEAKGIKKVTLPQGLLDRYGIEIPQ